MIKRPWIKMRTSKTVQIFAAYFIVLLEVTAGPREIGGHSEKKTRKILLWFDEKNSEVTRP